MMTNSSEGDQQAPQGRFNRTPDRLLGIQRRLGELVFSGIILFLVVVTSLAAYRNVAHGGWNADAAAWAQAAGSIIAVAGAAWLARGEARQARRWRREQGEEAAWGVRFVVSQAQFDAQIIAFELTKVDHPFDSFSMRSWRQRSANASLALQAMLTRADYIHPAVVLTACNAKILVDELTSDLAKMGEMITRDETPDDQVVADIVAAHLNLKTLIEQYDARIRGIRQALDRGRDALPLGEWPT